MVEKNILFRRLLAQSWYPPLLAQRWEQHQRSDVLSLARLRKRIDELVATVAPYTDENFTHWPVDGSPYYDDNDFAQEVELLTRFVELRHEQLGAQMARYHEE